MKNNIYKWLSILTALVLTIAFGLVLTMYVTPMENVSLDLSLPVGDTLEAPTEFDSKGWTVFIQEGDVRTELQNDGFGGYTGLEPGQTFYYSRVMEEDLDSPTLQISAPECTVAVWLDDMLIYTDHPEMKCQIGHLTLPMREYLLESPITISLPLDYQGKTLTIAQSFPEIMETNSVTAMPSLVKLYCGFAYESELISESFAVSMLTMVSFAVAVVLLIAFIRNRDMSMLFLALFAFLLMTLLLTKTSFFSRYFSIPENSISYMIPILASSALMIFLAAKGGKYRWFLWVICAVQLMSTVICTALIIVFSDFSFSGTVATIFSFVLRLAEWSDFAVLIATLVLSTAFWRKEQWFWKVFTPLAFIFIALYWILYVIFVDQGQTFEQIKLSLENGQITYIYYKTYPGIAIAALISAIAATIRNELIRYSENRLMKRHQELALASYENIQRQHEEVMMLRHDMQKHFTALRSMTDHTEITEYLDKLIDDNEKIRPVIQSGNKMFDIILNSKLAAANAKNIKVQIVRTDVAENLPLSNSELCSLIMNLLDNAIEAASQVKNHPQIDLDMHKKGAFFVFSCTNSVDPFFTGSEQTDTSPPMHGLGLKIVQRIADTHDCLVQTSQTKKQYTVTVAIPLVS